MKRILRTIGLLAIYYALPILVIFLVITGLNQLKLMEPLTKLAPSLFYGVSDPILILLMFLIFRLLQKKSLGPYCNFSFMTGADTLKSVALGFCLGVFTYSFVTLDSVKTNFPGLGDSVKYFLLGGNLYFLIYAVIVNSISKEIGFRGLIFNELRGNIPVSVALLVQALCYASQVFISAGVVLAMYGFLGAFVFGLVYYLGKSLWASILAEISCTLGMVLIDRTGLSRLFNAQSALPILILSIAAIILLVSLMYRRFKTQITIPRPV